MGFYASRYWWGCIGRVPERYIDANAVFIVLSHTSPPIDYLQELFPKHVQALVLIPGVQSSQHDNIHFSSYQLGSDQPLLADATAFLEKRPNTVVLLDPLSAMPGRVLLFLAKNGVKRALMAKPSGWLSTYPHLLVGLIITQRALSKKFFLRVPIFFNDVSYRLSMPLRKLPFIGRLSRLLIGPTSYAELCQTPAWSAIVKRRRVDLDASKLPTSRLRIAVFISNLNSGGAERQACNLAIALINLGHAVTVFTMYPIAGEAAHYAELLQQNGVVFSEVGQERNSAAYQTLEQSLDNVDFFKAEVPEEIQRFVLDLAGELIANPPDILHCLLDLPNVAGGLAGVIARIPRIILSTRNFNPTKFPGFYRTWMDQAYRKLAAVPGIDFIANSRHGGDDYALWMGIAKERFQVMPNAVNLPMVVPYTDADRMALREELGIASDAPFILGVFRLSQEKRPRFFVKVVHAALQRVPDLKCAIAGIGDLHDDLSQTIAKLNLTDKISLLGQRKDVQKLMFSADLLLLTSIFEGMPNVVLEAQWIGCPTVATAVGGTPEIIDNGRTGFIAPPDDFNGIVDYVVQLLQNQTLCNSIADNAQTAVRQKHAMQHIAAKTVNAYTLLK